MPTKSSNAQEIVYAESRGELVFIPKERARELATIHAAVQTATTWGEFEARVPAHVYAQIIAFFQEDIDDGNDEVEIPRADDDFDADDIPGYADGDWPGWPAQDMLEWVPKDIQQQFGRVQSSTLNGFYLELDIARKQEIVEALKQHGYVCVEDEALVEQANGW